MEQKLVFREDKTFKIIQFTDIHYTNDDEEDRRSVRMIREIIETEQPDFIIATGDTVYGERSVEYLSKALAPFIESKIPWSFTFGNHDVEFSGTHEELFQEVIRLPGCVAFHDESSVDGMGNHVLPITDRNGAVKWMVIGIDSGDYNPMEGVGGYGCITRNQIKWYQDKIKEQEAVSGDFSVIAFQHMAIPEFEDMIRFEPLFGVKRDGIGCPHVNSGFFHGMLEAGHTKGLFVGHDHLNDCYGTLYGITLGYGRASGYGGYGAQDYPRGARVFILREDELEHFDTYVRLEHGGVIDDPWKYRPLERRDEG